MDGDEVVQLYIQYPTDERMPVIELKEFRRITVVKNNQKSVSFRVPIRELQKCSLNKNTWETVEGEYQIIIGGHSETSA